jgi:hypothetical protein
MKVHFNAGDNDVINILATNEGAFNFRIHRDTPGDEYLTESRYISAKYTSANGVYDFPNLRANDHLIMVYNASRAIPAGTKCYATKIRFDPIDQSDTNMEYKIFVESMDDAMQYPLNSYNNGVEQPFILLEDMEIPKYMVQFNNNAIVMAYSSNVCTCDDHTIVIDTAPKTYDVPVISGVLKTTIVRFVQV